jgi:hypothetical protein
MAAKLALETIADGDGRDGGEENKEKEFRI